MSEKRCPKCEQAKPASDYWRRAKSWDGLQPYCKACQNGAASERKRTARLNESPEQRHERIEASRLYRRENKERVNDYAVKWQRANKEKFRSIQAAHRRRAAEQISDAYVRRMLSSRSTLKPSQIPDALVQLKRQFISLNREIKAQEQK
ncbi:MAG: hypothetical protein QM777_08840 [Pseudorhodoferax sp.]